MSWQGRINGTDGLWGDPGAAWCILADDAAPADPVPARLIPETPALRPDGVTLPPLGALGARDRVALAGFQHLNPHWDGVAVVVTGDATLWATLSAGEVIHLQPSAVPAIARGLGIEGAQATGFDRAQDRPERVMFHLADAPDDAHRLGALIGADIGAARTLWLGMQAALIGEGALSQGYAAGLAAAHVPVTRTDATALVRKGFAALAAKLHQPG